MGVKVEQVTQPVWIGEGPHWDEEQQCLYYISIFDCTIHKYDPETGKDTRTTLPDKVGFSVPLAGTKDQFVVGIGRKVLLVQWDGKNRSKAEILSEIAEVDQEPENSTNRLNDGKADPTGRLFGGSMAQRDAAGNFPLNRGSLFTFKNNVVEKKADKISISNGLCWDINKKIMYYIDTLENLVRAYDYDFDTGKMSNQKTVIDFKKKNLEGAPDGMTIDTNGNLWIACFEGSQVINVDPVTGNVIQKISIPAHQVTSVAFGGKNLDELYVTTGSLFIGGKEQLPPCGSMFKVTGLGVKGYPGHACIL